MHGQWGAQWVDDGAAIQRGASAMVSAALSAQVTATQVRSQWLALRTAYRAPEAEAVLSAMDAPRLSAVSTLSRVRQLRDTLWAYADRLDALASTWVEAEDLAEFIDTRDAADAECARAIAALTGPVARSFGSTPRRLGAASPAPRADDWSRPVEPQYDPLDSFIHQWGGFRPPERDDAIARGLYSMGLITFAGSTRASWVAEVDFSSVAHPHPRDLKVSKAAAGWAGTAKVLDGAGLGLTFATASWSQWRDADSYETDERLGRSLTVGATTTAGAWAGGQAGAWAGGAIGTAICPGVGTAVGAAAGGVIGGFAGSEVGGWVGDQVVDIGGHAGDLVGDGVDWAGDMTGDTLDTLSFWD